MSAIAITPSPLRAGQSHMAASPFETPPLGRLLRVRILENLTEFLILRAGAASVSKDEEFHHAPHAIALPARGRVGVGVKRNAHPHTLTRDDGAATE